MECGRSLDAIGPTSRHTGDVAPPERTARRGRDEHGVVIVLTSIAMIVMISFTALAIDLGMRNQYLARDQHAIDSASLAASYEAKRLGTDPTRFNVASARAKQMIQENMGIDTAGWAHCHDNTPYATIASDDVALDNNCISFGLDDDGTTIVRVTLPDHSIDTIFGRALGVSKIQVSAIANSDGSNCTNLTNPAACGTPPSVTTPGSTIDPVKNAWCLSQLRDDIWLFTSQWALTDECQDTYHYSDSLVQSWLTANCNVTAPGHPYQVRRLTTTLDTFGPNAPYTTDITEELLYTHFDMCYDKVQPARTNWLNQNCAGFLSSGRIWTQDELFWACESTLGLHYSDYVNHHPATTTTAAAPSSSTPASTSTGLPTTVPDYIDLSG